jgi:hypothetical protein
MTTALVAGLLFLPVAAPVLVGAGLLMLWLTVERGGSRYER